MKKQSLQFIFGLVFGFSSLLLSAQQQISLGTDVPLQYALGYRYTPEKGIGGGLKIGLLTEPNSSIILWAMESLGTKPTTVEIIRESFQMGLILDGDASWNWGKNFAGINLIYINLQAGQPSLDLIDSEYGSVYEFWDWTSSIYSQDQFAINLSSNLLQLGAHYGRRVPLNDQFELQFEIGLSKNIGSTNKISSGFPYPQSLYSSIDEDLKENYSKYGIIPTLGVHLVYNLNN